MLHKKNVNRGFTLVELLSVIVILAIILVIAVPKIMDVINSSKKSTLETSAKMIASSAEKTKMQNKLLGKDDTEITCESVSKITSDYASCKIDFDGNTAKVSIKGTGKFKGLYVCNGTKNNAKASSDKCPTDVSYFEYELTKYEDIVVYNTKVVDKEKCTQSVADFTQASEEEIADHVCYLTEDGYNNSIKLFANKAINDNYISRLEEFGLTGNYTKLTKFEVENVDKCTTYVLENLMSVPEGNEEAYNEALSYAKGLCSGNSFNGWTLKSHVLAGSLSDYESAGLTVTFSKEYIDINSVGKVTIFGYNSKGGTDVVVPTTIEDSPVVSIMDYALYENNLTSVELLNTDISIGNCAFGDKSKLSENNLPSSYTCDVSTLSSYLSNNGSLSVTTATYNGTTYDAGLRYTGTDPDNYVYFNCDDDGSNCEIWRIIGVFNVDNGSGVVEKRIKIINTNSTLKAEWNANGINQWGPSTYEEGTTYEGADIYKLLNGYYIGKSSTCGYSNYGYVNNIWGHFNMSCNENSLKESGMKPLTSSAKNLICEAKWNTYGVSGYYHINNYAYHVSDSTEAWLEENGISQQYTCTNCIDNVKRTTSWVGLIGLMSVSDIEFSNNWLYKDDKKIYPWAITPYETENDTVWISYSSHYGYLADGAESREVSSNSGVYPTVYLKPDVMFSGGTGTIDRPYKLSIN